MWRNSANDSYGFMQARVEALESAHFMEWTDSDILNMSTVQQVDVKMLMLMSGKIQNVRGKLKIHLNAVMLQNLLVALRKEVIAGFDLCVI